MSFNFPDIDADATLDRMAAIGSITAWCSKHQVVRRTLYNVLRRERGKRRDAREARRIIALLREDGYLVEVAPVDCSVPAPAAAVN